MLAKKQVQQTLESIGFGPNYVTRAFKIYEKNYGYSYNVEVMIEVIVRLQNKDKVKLTSINIPKQSANSNSNNHQPESFEFNTLKMTLSEANNLEVGDNIDHRDISGKFYAATVCERKDTNCLKIHYVGCVGKCDVWSDYKVELHRFSKYKKISGRAAHRFKQLKIGDFVDINSIRHRGWTCGEIKGMCAKSGQIKVMYKTLDINWLVWAHLDDGNEIAEFTSKSLENEINGKSNNKKRKSIMNDEKSEPPKKKPKILQLVDNDIPKILPLPDNDIPQWVNCNECNKWRIVPVLYTDIANWTPPLNWKCRMNKCSLPQPTAMYLSQTYSKYQLMALNIQRNNIQMNKLNNSDIMEENKKLKQEMEEINKKLSLCHGESDIINTFSLDELDGLYLKLQTGINVINEAKERLLENKLYCIICLKNAKNVVILECGHCDLCSDCQQKLPSKICPRCQKPFQNVTKINI